MLIAINYHFTSLIVLKDWPWPRGSSRTPLGGLGLANAGVGLGSRPRPIPF